MADQPKEWVVHVPGYSQPFRAPGTWPEERVIAAIEGLKAQGPRPLTLGEKLQQGLETYGPAVGSIAGATAAAAAPVPGARIAGAALGGAAGSMMSNVTRPILAPDQPPVSIWNQYKRAVIEGGQQGLGEAAVPLLARGLFGVEQAALGGAKRLLTGGTVAPEVQAARKALSRVGGELSVGQFTKGATSVGNILESISENALLGSKRFAAFRQGQTESMRALAQDVADGIGARVPSPTVSDVIVGLRQQNLDTFRQAARVKYQDVDRLAQGTGVDVSAPYTWLKQQLAKGRGDVRVAIRAAFPEGLDETLTQLVPGPNGTAARVPVIPFEQATRARTEMLRLSRAPEPMSLAQRPVPTTAGYIGKQLDAAIESAGQRLNPAALAAWRSANTFWQEGQDQFNNEIIRGLVNHLKKEPGAMSQALLKPGRPDIASAVRSAIGDQEYMSQVQPRLAHAMFDRASDPSTGILQPRALLQQMKTMGKETLEQTFAPGTQAAMTDLANALDVASRRPSGPGRVWISLAQIGAMGTVLADPSGMLSGEAKSGLAGAIVLGPLAISHLFTNPRFVHALADGIRQGPGSTLLARSLGQLAVATAGSQRPPMERMPEVE